MVEEIIKKLTCELNAVGLFLLLVCIVEALYIRSKDKQMNAVLARSEKNSTVLTELSTLIRMLIDRRTQ